jgi:hypothetical protein
MDAEKDYNLLSEIMHNANIGWWKADIQDADYIYYGPIASLLGLEEGGCISFENFNKRILREEQPHTTIRSFDNIQQTNETVYLLDTVKGPTWVRSKICMQKTDENGKTYQQLSIQLTSGEKFYYALSVSGTTQTITSADYDEWSLSANTDSLVYGLKEDVTEKYQTDYPKLEKAYATQFIQ